MNKSIKISLIKKHGNEKYKNIILAFVPYFGLV